MIAYDWNPSTGESEASGFRVLYECGLHREFKASLGNLVRLLKK